jgi:hypothetical protein
VRSAPVWHLFQFDRPGADPGAIMNGVLNMLVLYSLYFGCPQLQVRREHRAHVRALRGFLQVPGDTECYGCDSELKEHSLLGNIREISKAICFVIGCGPILWRLTVQSSERVWNHARAY